MPRRSTKKTAGLLGLVIDVSFALVIGLAQGVMTLAAYRKLSRAKPSTPPKAKGTIHKERHQEFMIGGLAFELSTEVRRYTEEEVRERATEDWPIFEQAFWKAAQNIQANRITLEAMISPFSVVFQTGDPRKQLLFVMSKLGDGQWKWPAYEGQLRREHAVEFAAEINEIGKMGVADLLCSESKADLKERYALLSDDTVGATRFKKGELAQAIIRQSSPAQLDQIERELRTKLLEGVDAGGEPLNNRDMCEAFIGEVHAIFYALKHIESASELKTSRPYWRWQTVCDLNTCSFCAKLDGKIFRYDDPIWSRLLDRPHIGCRCSFRTYNDEDMHAKGLRVIHSSGLNLGTAI